MSSTTTDGNFVSTTRECGFATDSWMLLRYLSSKQITFCSVVVSEHFMVTCVQPL